MKGIIDPISFSNFFSPSKNQFQQERILFWITIIVSLLASFEFGQDYIESILNNSNFSILQSLSYKAFWFVFIPFTLIFMHWQNKYKLYEGKGKGPLKTFCVILVLTFLHLLVFSLFLHIISFTINEKPWPLTYLLTQKLSTRLYLGLSFYLIFSFIYYHCEQQTLKSKDKKHNRDSLLIKSGHKTTRVSTQEINWVVSDGPYIEIHTTEKKYVILDSLKNIINALPENFHRIHKSTIVNIDQIESSKSRGNGDYDLILKAGKIVRLSRNYAKPLKGILH